MVSRRVLLVLLLPWFNVTPSSGLAAESDAVQVEKLYFDGRLALRDKRLHEAIRAFDRALALQAPPELRVRLLRAYGHTAGLLVEEDRALACAGVDRYRAWLEAAPADDDDRPMVGRSLVDMQQLCALAQPAPSAVGVSEIVADGTRVMPDHTLTWTLGGVAVAALVAGAVCTTLIFTTDEQYREIEHTLASTTQSDRKVALLGDLQRLRGEQAVLEGASVGLYIAAGAFALGAGWVWWSAADADGTQAVVHFGPGMLGIGGQW